MEKDMMTEKEADLKRYASTRLSYFGRMARPATIHNLIVKKIRELEESIYQYTMKRDSSIEDIIIEYSSAYNDARKNASILVANNHNKATLDLCIDRIKRCDKATHKLFMAYDRDDVPDILKKFYDAENDKGCSSCWRSSLNKDMHTDCIEKMSIWFDAQESLVKYGLELRGSREKNS